MTTRAAKLKTLGKRHTTLYYRIHKDQRELDELEKKLNKLAEQERVAKQKAYDKRLRAATRKLRSHGKK